MEKLDDVEQILEICCQTLQELTIIFFASDQYCKFSLKYVDDLLDRAVGILQKMIE